MSFKAFKSLFAGLLSICLVMSPLSVGAQSLSLTEARDQGLVGERPDGLIGVVVQPTAQLTTLVDQVNQARMAEYRKLATARGVPLEAVQAIAGEEQLERASASGWLVLGPSGQWRPGG